MLPRRSMAFPLSLGITMICLLIVVIVGWILLTVYGATSENGSGLYWVFLTVGTFVLCGILAGVAFYLAYSVKVIQINRRQANFIDAVTHELKSPIASLKLGLETMSRRRLSENDAQKFTIAMKKDVDRMDRLVSHLLDAAGLNVTREEPNSEVIDFQNVIRECITEVCTYHDFSEEFISVNQTPLSFVGTRLDFEIIFRNLIDNAVKYVGNPPQISIHCETDVVSILPAKKSAIQISIENNGKSVPDSEKHRVFGRFERTGIELQRTTQGVGLGLFIVRLLLKRNRGQVRLETPESLNGTRVVVQLPAEDNPSLEDDKTTSTQIVTKGKLVG
jgi:signal transduction histidine kinase